MSIEPEQFEAGENVTDQVRRGRPTGVVVSVRLTQEDSERLFDLADETGKTISQLARQAIQAFVSQRAHPPTFVPEITGNMPPLFNVVAVAPLGPRTVNEGHGELDEKPPVRTGYLIEVS